MVAHYLMLHYLRIPLAARYGSRYAAGLRYLNDILQYEHDIPTRFMNFRVGLPEPDMPDKKKGGPEVTAVDYRKAKQPRTVLPAAS
jgi:hypothetical protein